MYYDKLKNSKDSANLSSSQYIKLNGNTYNNLIPEYIKKANSKDSSPLPNNLKSKLKNMSNLSLDDVRVHFNSQAPKIIGATAYTYKNHIHMQNHDDSVLAHEAFHIVQQKQGRVTANRYFNGLNVNNDNNLENESDEFSKAYVKGEDFNIPKCENKEIKDANILQGIFKYKGKTLDNKTLDYIIDNLITSISNDPLEEDNTAIKFDMLASDEDVHDISDWSKENFQYLIDQYLEMHFNEQTPIPGNLSILDANLNYKPSKCNINKLTLTQEYIDFLRANDSFINNKLSTSYTINSSSKSPSDIFIKNVNLCKDNFKLANSQIYDHVSKYPNPSALDLTDLLIQFNKLVTAYTTHDFMIEMKKKTEAVFRTGNFMNTPFFSEKQLNYLLAHEFRDFFEPFRLLFDEGSDDRKYFDDIYIKSIDKKLSYDMIRKAYSNYLPGKIRDFRPCYATDGLSQKSAFQRKFYDNLSKDPNFKNHNYSDKYINFIKSIRFYMPPNHTVPSLLCVMQWLSKQLPIINSKTDLYEKLTLAIETSAKTFLSLISIHPFIDGNGRTCRTMADYVMIKSGFIPLADIQNKFIANISENGNSLEYPGEEYLKNMCDYFLKSMLKTLDFIEKNKSK